MGELIPYGDGTLADNLAIVIDEIIDCLQIDYTFYNDVIDHYYIPYGCIRILVVGYRGNDTCIICYDWLSELSSDFYYEKCNFFSEDGLSYEGETIKVVEPVASGSFSLDKALFLIRDELSSWLTFYGTKDDLAPLIVNVTTDGYVTDDSRIVPIVNEIMEQKIPDGNPIFYNLRLSYDKKSLLEFPHEMSHCLDAHAKLLFASSSTITEDLKNRCYKFFSNRECHEGSRLFVDNIPDRQSLEGLFSFVFEYFRRK